MAIQPMRRVYLFLPASGRRRLLSLLKELGVIEVTTLPEKDRELAGPAPDRRRRNGEKTSPERLNQALEYLRPEGAVPAPRVRREDITALAESVDIEQVLAAVDRLKRREREISALDRRLREREAGLAPCRAITAPLRLLGRETKGQAAKTSFALYRLDRKGIAFLAEHRLPDGVFSETALEESRSRILFVAWRPEDEDRLAETLGRAGAERVPVPGHRTGGAESLERISRLLEKNRARRARLEQARGELRRELPGLFARLDMLLLREAELAAGDRIHRLGRTAVMAGWIRASDLPRLEEALGRQCPETAVFARRPEKGEEVPVALDNGPAGRPFEAVMDLYGRTAYTGTDPSRYLAFFFALGFAFCLGDAGYGLMLTVISRLLMKRFTSPEARKMLQVFFFSGLATIAAGIITNSWFGDIFQAVPALSFLGNAQRRLSLVSPADNPADTMKFFYFVLLLGYAQVSFGIFLNLRRAVSADGLRGAAAAAPALIFQLAIPLAALLFFLGDRFAFTGPALRGLAALLAVSAVLVVINQWQLYRDTVQRLFWSLYTIYGMVVNSLLSDILSYARIFALGLTSALLAVTVNILAVMAGGTPLVGPLAAALILLAGHGFNLFISTLGSYVHTSRLQYLEFFTKFYQGGGRPFRPLREEFRHFNVAGDI